MTIDATSKRRNYAGSLTAKAVVISMVLIVGVSLATAVVITVVNLENNAEPSSPAGATSPKAAQAVTLQPRAEQPVPVVQVPLSEMAIVACADAIHYGRNIRAECGDQRTYDAGNARRIAVEKQMSDEADLALFKAANAAARARNVAEAEAAERERDEGARAGYEHLLQMGRDAEAESRMQEAQMKLDVALSQH